jgi:methyltransferase family protein
MTELKEPIQGNKIILARYWGYYMASEANIHAFTSALAQSSTMHPEGIRYLEIGLGNCGTINAVDWTLSQLPGNHRIVGIEHVSWTMAFLMPYLAELVIRDQHQVPDGEWDVVFIDACHCKQCVINDFDSIKDRLSDRAFVIFHDTNPEAQEMHANMSSHQHEGIKVLEGLAECDLSGFNLLHNTPGSKTSNGLRVYQKEPMNP